MSNSFLRVSCVCYGFYFVRFWSNVTPTPFLYADLIIHGRGQELMHVTDHPVNSAQCLPGGRP